MTKKRAKQYWRILNRERVLSDTEAMLLAEAMRVLNRPVKKRK